MIDGTYRVEANTPIGRKKGTVTLTSNGNKADATAKALGKTFKATGTCDGDSFSFEGEIKVLLKSAHYKMQGTANGTKLSATALAGGHTVQIESV